MKKTRFLHFSEGHLSLDPSSVKPNQNNNILVTKSFDKDKSV